MKMFAFIIAATSFEAVGDALMRIALHHHSSTGRVGLFAAATALLGMYGLFLNLAPVEFAEATGVYLASLFVMFQVVNFLFFRVMPSPAILVGGAFIVTGSAIIYFWK
jgi:hypothetical protein